MIKEYSAERELMDENGDNASPPVVQGVVMAPCPFCGKTTALRICDSYEDAEEIDYCNQRYFAVICDDSKSYGVGPGGCGAMGGYMPTEDEAIARWNNRYALGSFDEVFDKTLPYEHEPADRATVKEVCREVVKALLP